MTSIEWTEATWNPIAGCTVHSPGCTNCYAMRTAARLASIPATAPVYAGLTQPSKAGPVWTGKIAVNESTMLAPLRRRKPTMYFVNSMSDLFHESVPDEVIDRVFAVMALCPQHTFQVLTKRSARMLSYLRAHGVHTGIMVNAATILGETIRFGDGQRKWPWPLPNVWLGVSVEDQKRADERIPDLLATPAAVRFLSCEPLLGSVDLTPEADSTYQMLSQWYGPDGFDETGSQPRQTRRTGWFPRLDWVIVGGESGPAARPMHPDWARSLRDQCAAAGVPFFFKQWGNYLPAGQVATQTGLWSPACGRPLCTTKKNAGRTLDGVTHDAMPQVQAHA